MSRLIWIYNVCPLSLIFQHESILRVFPNFAESAFLAFYGLSIRREIPGADEADCIKLTCIYKTVICYNSYQKHNFLM